MISPAPGRAVTDLLKRRLRERGVSGLQLLQTHDVRLARTQPVEKVSKALVDVVDVEGGNFHLALHRQTEGSSISAQATSHYSMDRLSITHSATRANETWAMDFVHDQLATGRKLRMLTIIDTFSRYSPAIEPRFTFRGADVVEILEEVGRQVGFPKAIRVDQGTEFVSRDLDLWAYQRGVTLDFCRPGKPTDNAFIESFNGKFRAECLNAHWFMSLDDARRKCEAWRRDYNEERPHSAIGNKAPIELIERSAALGPG
jgi:putative transposase